MDRVLERERMRSRSGVAPGEGKGRGGCWGVEAWVYLDGEGMTSLRGVWRRFLVLRLRWLLLWFSLWRIILSGL